MITSNLTVDDKKLDVELQSPFSMIYDLNKTQEWGRLREVIINLEPNQVSLIERIVSVLNINLNTL